MRIGVPGSPEGLFRHLALSIAVGSFEPGTRFRDKEVAAELGLSRTPVRDAVHRLARARLLEVHASRFTIVSELTVESSREVREFASAQASQLVGSVVPALRHAERARAVELVRAAYGAVRDDASWVSSHIELLRFLSARTRNPLYSAVLGDFWFLALRDVFLGAPAEGEGGASPLHKLEEGLVNGDPSEASQAMRLFFNEET